MLAPTPNKVSDRRYSPTIPITLCSQHPLYTAPPPFTLASFSPIIRAFRRQREFWLNDMLHGFPGLSPDAIEQTTVDVAEGGLGHLRASVVATLGQTIVIACSSSRPLGWHLAAAMTRRPQVLPEDCCGAFPPSPMPTYKPRLHCKPLIGLETRIQGPANETDQAILVRALRFRDEPQLH